MGGEEQKNRSKLSTLRICLAIEISRAQESFKGVSLVKSIYYVDLQREEPGSRNQRDPLLRFSMI